MEVTNVVIRLNREFEVDNTIGWGDCNVIDGEDKLAIQNVKIKKKILDPENPESSKFKTVFEYPHKIARPGGGDAKKIHYVKPVSKSMYDKIERAFIHEIYIALKASNGAE